MLGQNQIRHFDHEYKQINISFESINDRKK